MIAKVQGRMAEKVCLVDEHDRPVGECLKAEVHGYHTPLHRAFSVFLFDAGDRLLVQRRAAGKLAWPGIWSNSCCGHPVPGEATRTAALRRLREELGVGGGALFAAVPDFRYRSRFNGIEENEICPVYIGRLAGVVRPDPDEIDAVDWIGWEAFLQYCDLPPQPRWGTFSIWSRLEAQRLASLGPRRRAILSSLEPFRLPG